MASRKPTLSKAEKDERDARAQRWMNNRKIERVAQAAERHGWYTFPTDTMVDLQLTDLGTYVFDYEGCTYRYEGANEDGEVIARKIT